jgi:hypothetical protein
MLNCDIQKENLTARSEQMAGFRGTGVAVLLAAEILTE